MEIRGLCFLPNESHPSKETVRKTNIIWYCVHVETKKKKDTNEFIYKTERGSQTYRTNLWLLGRREGDRLGAWDGHVNTAMVKLDNQQGPTAQHRECCTIFCNNLK